MHQTTLTSKSRRKMGKKMKKSSTWWVYTKMSIYATTKAHHINTFLASFRMLKPKSWISRITCDTVFHKYWTLSKVVIFMAPRKVRERNLEMKEKYQCLGIDMNMSPFYMYLSWVSMMQCRLLCFLPKGGYVVLPSYYTMKTWFTTNCPPILDPNTLKTR